MKRLPPPLYVLIAIAATLALHVLAPIVAIASGDWHLAGLLSIVLGSVLILIAGGSLTVVLALAIVLDRGFIKDEERMLDDTFGEEFRLYQSRVRKRI